MKPRLLAVEAEPAAFAPLVEALSARALRCGWLDLGRPAAGPPELEAAADLGVLRAVAATGSRVVGVKPVKGAPVLRDLLREHFTGCALVLVRGGLDVARLRPELDGWSIAQPGGGEERLSTAELVEKLGRPGWGR